MNVDALSEATAEDTKEKPGKACETCRYSNMTEKDAGLGVTVPLRECRFHAPQIIHGSGTGWSSQMFPYVEDDDWCGDWEENKSA